MLLINVLLGVGHYVMSACGIQINILCKYTTTHSLSYEMLTSWPLEQPCSWDAQTVPVSDTNFSRKKVQRKVEFVYKKTVQRER
jgi:hypothetical protein